MWSSLLHQRKRGLLSQGNSWWLRDSLPRWSNSLGSLQRESWELPGYRLLIQWSNNFIRMEHRPYHIQRIYSMAMDWYGLIHWDCWFEWTICIFWRMQLCANLHCLVAYFLRYNTWPDSPRWHRWFVQMGQYSHTHSHHQSIQVRDILRRSWRYWHDEAVVLSRIDCNHWHRRHEPSFLKNAVNLGLDQQWLLTRWNYKQW